MTRVFTTTAASAALALAAGSAFAQDNTEGLYVGGGFGDFMVEINDIDDVNDAVADFDEDDSASKFFAGWRLNRFLALQGDYYDLGNMTTTFKSQQVAAKTDGFAASVVGTLPLAFIELFARAGLIFYDVEVDRGTTSVVDEGDDDFVYSAGIGFVLFERVNLQLEYEVLDIKELDTSDAWWLNASWRF
jgi:hypothetical protein